MFLLSFNANKFRNLEGIKLDPDKRCNIFYGENGSGKTSILESIYYLSLGRSFRSHLLRRIIKYHNDGFSLFGEIKSSNDEKLIPIGISRSLTCGKRIRISGRDICSNIELAKIFPVQLINQDSYCLINNGPNYRRQFMDWGIFYSDINFINLWVKTKRIIDQRNTALKKNMDISLVRVWDEELARFSLELHLAREKYIKELKKIALPVINKLLENLDISIDYFSGWDVDRGLERVLFDSLKNDMRCGYTTFGPHRADILLHIGNIPAKDALSRGQQKLLFYGLQLSQGMLLYELVGKNCIYLLDDFPAELSQRKQKILAEILSKISAQIFATGLNYNDLNILFGSQSGKMFHVEHGAIL